MADDLLPAGKHSNENEEMLNKTRLQLFKVKKENFEMKKKLEGLESERDLYSFDESFI